MFRKNNRAAIYARVSTDEQAREGFSVAAQIDDLHKYASIHNMDVVHEYVDEGVSGKSISGRPQMKQLLSDAKNQKFDVVLVYKIDRLSRNLRDALEISDELQQSEVKLISLTESFDTSTPMGMMVFQLMGSFAELERKTIVNRVKSGMTQRAKEGKFNGGVCLGYVSKDKKLIINDDEAIIVKEIFKLSEQGLGYKAIVNRINEKGYKTKRGKQFSISGVKQILDNPMYIGKISFNKNENWNEKRRKGKNPDYILVDGEHEPIITLEQWDKVQSIRKNRSYKPTRSHEPYILSRIIKCPMCGSGMVPGRSKVRGLSYRYYVCGEHHNKGKTACGANSIRADVAEKEVMEQISKLVSDSIVLKKIIANVNEQRANAHDPVKAEKKLIEKQLKQTQNKIDNLLNILAENPELSSIKPKIQSLEGELNQLHYRLSELDTNLSEADTAPVDYDSLRIVLSDFQQLLEKVSPEEQKALLSLAIKDIQITNDAPRGVGRKVEKINLHFDFTIDAMNHTYELINQLYPDLSKQLYSWDKPSKYRKLNKGDLLESLNVLPLLMVRFTLHNPKRPIHLLQ
jgi:site-specific DNA recombinase